MFIEGQPIKSTFIGASLFFVFIAALPVGAVPADFSRHTDDASKAMQALYLSIQDQFDDNAFGQPLHLTSKTVNQHTSAALNAVMAHPFETFMTVFTSAADWCGIMMLHLNVKYCAATQNGKQGLLTVFVGQKHEQPLESAYRSDYTYQVMQKTQDYFQVAVMADQGPLSTRNYQITLEAVPLDSANTFIRFTYAYDFGLLARAAKSLYFNTAGREKVGFTTVSSGSKEPQYIGGVRGALERNIMRYYLAIKAYLNSLSAPSSQQLEKRLEEWFALTERYARQLHEIEKNDYLRMKRLEFKRLEK